MTDVQGTGFGLLAAWGWLSAVKHGQGQSGIGERVAFPLEVSEVKCTFWETVEPGKCNGPGFLTLKLGKERPKGEEEWIPLWAHPRQQVSQWVQKESTSVGDWGGGVRGPLPRPPPGKKQVQGRSIWKFRGMVVQLRYQSHLL